MNSSDNMTNSSQPLLSLLGENYEYIKTIATNHIAIKKLQVIEVVGTILSRFIFIAICLVFSFLLAILLVSLAVLGLYHYFGSLLIALGATCAILLLIILLIFIFRYQLIYNRVFRTMESLATKNIA